MGSVYGLCIGVLNRLYRQIVEEVLIQEVFAEWTVEYAVNNSLGKNINAVFCFCFSCTPRFSESLTALHGM